MTNAALSAPGPDFTSAPPRPLREDRKSAQLTGWLVRIGSDAAFDFTIRDLSYGGCRIDTAAPLVRGEKLALNVIRRGTIPAVVRWRNGHGVGLSFAIDDAPRREKPRKVSRFTLTSEIVVRRAGRRNQAVTISDLSRFGCCLTFVDPPRAEEWIWVSLPGLSPIEARVRWVDALRAGIEFARPVHEAVFDLLLDHWGITLDAAQDD